MNILKASIIAASLLGVTVLNAAPLVVNAEAVGKSSLNFLEQLDDQMPGYIRGLSYQKPTEFQALQFAAMLNQSANIEKKLDVLRRMEENPMITQVKLMEEFDLTRKQVQKLIKDLREDGLVERKGSNRS